MHTSKGEADPTAALRLEDLVPAGNQAYPVSLGGVSLTATSYLSNPFRPPYDSDPPRYEGDDVGAHGGNYGGHLALEHTVRSV